MAVSVMSNWLDTLDRAIWPEQNSVDCATLTHYFYSPYPAGLGSEDIKKWAHLQSQVLAPFPNSYHYIFKSKKGLHLWFSASEFDGIPETAAQTPLHDGKHTVYGENFKYLQEWQNGVLISCVSLNANDDAEDATLTGPNLTISHHGWATERQLLSTISKPLFWACVSLFMLACVLLFALSSTLSTNAQLATLSNESEELSELVGPKLTQQSTLAGYISGLEYIRTSQSEFVFLPEAISIGLNTLPQSTDPIIQSIVWQNNQLNIAIEAANLDITQIIESAESNERIQTANIRPQGSQNTWVLELTF